MNIHDALKLAREQNVAITRSDFPEGVYVQHGMDNLLRFEDGRECCFAVADLLSTDWKIYQSKPYHQETKNIMDAIQDDIMERFERIVKAREELSKQPDKFKWIHRNELSELSTSLLPSDLPNAGCKAVASQDGVVYLCGIEEYEAEDAIGATLNALLKNYESLRYEVSTHFKKTVYP